MGGGVPPRTPEQAGVVAATVAHVSTGQGEQRQSPWLEYVPAGHTRHAEPPAAGMYSPAPHGVQDPALAAVDTKPRGQGTPMVVLAPSGQ